MKSMKTFPPSGSNYKNMDYKIVENYLYSSHHDKDSVDMIMELLQFILRKNTWVEFVKNFNNNGGFSRCTSTIFYEIINEFPQTGDHSGCSLSCTFRNCQHLLNHFSDESKQESKQESTHESLNYNVHIKNKPYDEIINCDENSIKNEFDHDFESMSIHSNIHETVVESKQFDVNNITTSPDTKSINPTSYPEYLSMSKDNKHIIDIMESGNMKEDIKEMFINPDDPNTPLTYAQMKEKYG